MEKHFPHSRRVRTLNEFNREVAMDLFRQFFSRKRARDLSVPSLKMSFTSLSLHQAASVLCFERRHCKHCPRRKIDFRSCVRCNLSKIFFLCPTSKKDCFTERHIGVQN